MGNFSYNMAGDTENIKTAKENFGLEKTKGLENTTQKRVSNKTYESPSFLGFSAIGWQSLFFLICGFSFIIYILKKLQNVRKT